MNENDALFARLDEALNQDGPAAVLDRLVDCLRDQQKHHELFEALKMKLRHQLGLPLRYNDVGDELDEATREGLEAGLIDACRQVGMLLLKDGKIREGWMYLRPVGDHAAVLSELAKQQPREDNLDEFVELCLHEGLDLQRGFQLMLENYGTCNSITTFESSMYGQPRTRRQIGAALLVKHVYGELLENVGAHIARHENQKPPASTLAQLIESRPWLFADGCYHIDTTHLASVVRFARDLEDDESLRMALELATYGNQLDPQLQYPADAPFAEFYPAHQRYFSALLGEDADQAIAYFRQQAEGSDPYEQSTLAIEVYVELLARLGRWQEAINETVRLLPRGLPITGVAPSLLDLSEACGDYGQLRKSCREQDDLLGYTLGLLNSSLVKR